LNLINSYNELVNNQSIAKVGDIVTVRPNDSMNDSTSEGIEANKEYIISFIRECRGCETSDVDKCTHAGFVIRMVSIEQYDQKETSLVGYSACDCSIFNRNGFFITKGIPGMLFEKSTRRPF
jgi:hypothetical protein